MKSLVQEKRTAPGKPTTTNPRADGQFNVSALEELLQALPQRAVERIYRLAWWEVLDRELRVRDPAGTVGEPRWRDTGEWAGCDFYFDGCSCARCEEADRRNKILRRWWRWNWNGNGGGD